jgi:hypothetical protein
MKTPLASDPQKYVLAIRRRGLSIYDPIAVGDPELWIPTAELQAILDAGMSGLSLAGLALRTRSKVMKEAICSVLGYQVPKSFQKTNPRFPGQAFDTYGQKKLNLQIWNEEVSSTRRYVLVGVSDIGKVTRVKVVNGDTLAALDKTGKLTQKYQAQFVLKSSTAELVVETDTDVLLPFVTSSNDISTTTLPIGHPQNGQLLTIQRLFERLSGLVGKVFPDAGIDQERNRGAALHRLVCKAVGYSSYLDDGQFPDVRHQLLEVKLQTARTIDLGLVCPNSISLLDIPMIEKTQIRHCDVRYAVFYGVITDMEVKLTHLVLTTGQSFFSRFPQFQGRVLNSKLQIPLPKNFFTT